MTKVKDEKRDEMTLENDRYYRVEHFDGSGKFRKLEVLRHGDRTVAEIVLQDSNVKVFKCNRRGNNYTGRMLYPFQEVKDYDEN